MTRRVQLVEAFVRAAEADREASWEELHAMLTDRQIPPMERRLMVRQLRKSDLGQNWESRIQELETGLTAEYGVQQAEKVLREAAEEGDEQE